jgi:hypothetical protein
LTKLFCKQKNHKSDKSASEGRTSAKRRVIAGAMQISTSSQKARLATIVEDDTSSNIQDKKLEESILGIKKFGWSPKAGTVMVREKRPTTLVITCLDYPLCAETVELMNDKFELRDIFNEIVLPGASLALVHEDSRKPIMQIIKLHIAKYQIRNIVFLDHHNCAIYKEVFGDIAVQKRETSLHAETLYNAKQIIQRHLPQLNVHTLCWQFQNSTDGQCLPFLGRIPVQPLQSASDVNRAWQQVTEAIHATNKYSEIKQTNMIEMDTVQGVNGVKDGQQPQGVLFSTNLWEGKFPTTHLEKFGNYRCIIPLTSLVDPTRCHLFHLRDQQFKHYTETTILVCRKNNDNPPNPKTLLDIRNNEYFKVEQVNSVTTFSYNTLYRVNLVIANDIHLSEVQHRWEKWVVQYCVKLIKLLT